MPTSIQQAGIDALAAYLDARLADVVVEPFWSEPDVRLPAKKISIIRAGPRHREPAIVLGGARASRDLVPPDPVRKEFRYEVGAFRQPIQLDLWTWYEATLDELEDQLDTELNRGEAITLGRANGNSIRDGVLLALDPASGHGGLVDFTATTEPERIYTADASKRHEWRSIIRAELGLFLCVWAESPRLAVTELQLTISQLDSPSEAAAETITINSP